MILPPWLKTKKTPLGKSLAVNNILKRHNLHTVCQSARCPNLFECFSRGTATFLILGDTCTRHCRFCSVKKQAPLPLVSDEPKKVADACLKMKLKHIVITSVTRDDLPDGGASIFHDTIIEVRRACPDTTIEVLTPDFQGQEKSISKVIEAKPDIFNHNIETVPRLYESIRPEADYRRSLAVLGYAKKISPGVTTKSGLMLGLGEEQSEVLDALKDLRQVACDVVTLGQYLRPSLKSETVAVARFVRPEEFDDYRNQAYKLGFKAVAAGPFVRSSYNAGELMKAL